MGIRVHQRLAILGDSPLRRARLEARLTLGNLAERVGVTPATVHRWELAEREPSPSIYLALGVVGLQREQEAWARTRARRRQRKPRSALRIEVILPSGLGVESAQQACTAALVSLVGGRQDGERHGGEGVADGAH